MEERREPARRSRGRRGTSHRDEDAHPRTLLSASRRARRPARRVHIASASNTSTVAGWAKGTTRPEPDVERRLRLAFHLVALLRNAEDDVITQAFFQGLDLDLGERSPATVLRTGSLDDEAPELLAAARRLLVGN